MVIIIKTDVISDYDIEKLLKIFSDWTVVKIDGEYFDDIFNIDGTPLWWFYKPIVMRNMLPFLDSLTDIVNMKNRKNPAENIYRKALLMFYRKALLYNEIKKSKACKKHIYDIVSKVAIVTYTNHVKNDTLHITDTLYKELRTRGINPLLLVFDTLSNTDNKKLDLDGLIYNYMDFDDKIIKKTAKELSNKWSSIDKKMFEFNGIEEHLDFLFSYEMIYLTILYYNAVKKFIKDNGIKIIFLTGDGTLAERCAIAAANNCDIYSTMNPAGIGAGIADYSSFEKAVFFAFGKEHADLLGKKHVKKECIKITGSLMFDDISKYMNIERTDNRKNILFITQAFIEKNIMSKMEYFSLVSSILKELEKTEANITIKLHPAEKNVEDYNNIAKNAAIIQKADNDALFSMIMNSDVIVGFKSSVLLMSMILNKPVISIKPMDSISTVDYDQKKEDDAMITLEGFLNLNKTINKLLSEKTALKKQLDKQKEYIDRFFYKVDGKSYLRIADEMQKLAKD